MLENLENRVSFSWFSSGKMVKSPTKIEALETPEIGPKNKQVYKPRVFSQSILIQPHIKLNIFYRVTSREKGICVFENSHELGPFQSNQHIKPKKENVQKPVEKPLRKKKEPQVLEEPFEKINLFLLPSLRRPKADSHPKLTLKRRRKTGEFPVKFPPPRPALFTSSPCIRSKVSRESTTFSKPESGFFVSRRVFYIADFWRVGWRLNVCLEIFARE